MQTPARSFALLTHRLIRFAHVASRLYYYSAMPRLASLDVVKKYSILLLVHFFIINYDDIHEIEKFTIIKYFIIFCYVYLF